jgi:hypothetical protein
MNAPKTAPNTRAHYIEVAEALAARNPDVVQAKMFGMPSLKANGKAFAGLYGDDMVFKLAAADHARALALAGAGIFDPSGRNRPMREWVQVPSTHAHTWEDLAAAALAYTAGE